MVLSATLECKNIIKDLVRPETDEKIRMRDISIMME